MKDWVFWLGFWFTIVMVIFLFFGLPLLAYLGYTRKLKFLPSMDELLNEFPNSLEDLNKRPPYNKLDTSTALSVLYFELFISKYLIKILRVFKKKKKGD